MTAGTTKVTIAFCWCFGPEVTPEDGCRKLADYGFEAVELWPEALARFGVRRWAAALQLSGLRCAQLCPYFDVVRGNHAAVASMAQLAGFLALAEALQCPRLRTFTGPPWGDEVVGPAHATDAQWHSAGEQLARLCDLAALHGVELCLECHEGSLMEDSASTRKLLNLVNRDNLTVNLQFPLVGETWQHSVEHLGPQTVHLHMHDWSDHPGGTLTNLGRGIFPWLAVMHALLAHAPRALVWSVEHADHHGRSDPWTTAAHDGPWLRTLRDQCGAV